MNDWKKDAASRCKKFENMKKYQTLMKSELIIIKKEIQITICKVKVFMKVMINSHFHLDTIYFPFPIKLLV